MATLKSANADMSKPGKTITHGELQEMGSAIAAGYGSVSSARPLLSGEGKEGY
jgi:hypothetical protein